MAKGSKSEFASISRLLVVAEARRWTDETTGQELIQYFNGLVEQAKTSQDGICEICRNPIDDSENVATRQEFIVHLTCREWPRTWLNIRKNPTLRKIRKSITAYNNKT